MPPSQKTSAGLLMFRRDRGGLEVFLVHPGGPFFARKDDGAWSIPKGEYRADEDPLQVARREFEEETGRSIESCASASGTIPLGSVRQSGGKAVTAWAVEGDWPEGEKVESNSFSIEWPPGSGQQKEFPEVDRGQFFPVEAARDKINPAQVAFLDRLTASLADDRGGAAAARESRAPR